MPLGDKDRQYDESRVEQEKVKRRLELKYRIKEEGINKRYNPFFHMKGVCVIDPAQERYTELRRRGRTPGAPLRPSLFFGMLAALFVPVIIVEEIVRWERSGWLRKVATGEIPFEDRQGKCVT